MANQYFNFYYDAVRQGYDSNTWNTLLGVPVVLSNQLTLTGASIMHFADILRGDAVFNINVSEPTAGDDAKIGFKEENGDIFAYFKILNDVLTAETSNGTTVESIAITWEDIWTSTNTEFRIKWEAGAVHFYIGGQWKATIGDESDLNVPVSVVPGTPMSLYLYNDSNDPLKLKYISIKGICAIRHNCGTDTGHRNGLRKLEFIAPATAVFRPSHISVDSI